MDANFWKDTLINNLAVPLILVAFGILIAIAQHYANKFVEMFTERQKARRPGYKLCKGNDSSDDPENDW